MSFRPANPISPEETMPLHGSCDKRRRQFLVSLVFTLLFFLAPFFLLPVACTRIPPVAPSPLSVGAIPAPDFNQLFTRSGKGWTGGDGTLSIGLPDGRTLWLFGDTFLGYVRPDGSRPLDSPLIRNCLVVQDGERLVTRHEGTTHDPRAFLVPKEPDTWYWPGDGTVWENQVWVFFHRFRQVTPGMWGWAWDGTVMAVLQLPLLSLDRVIDMSHDHGVAYGAALYEADAWVYIFGTEQRGAVKHLHLARAPRGGLEGSWHYWAGQHWSDNPGASRSILAGVSSQFGVVGLEQGLGLVTMDDRQPFSDRIVLYLAEAPTGPWQGPVDIYRAPEASRAVAAYNPFVHPQFSRQGTGHLISYNINHVHDPDTLYDDAGLYRPRFIWVDLDRLDVRLAGQER